MNTEEKIQQRRKEAAKRRKQNKKRDNAKVSRKTKNVLWTILGVVIGVLILFALIFPNTGWSRRALTAVTIGDTKVNTAEYSYYYRSAFSNYYNTMVSYLGEANVPLDKSRSLDKQTMSDGTSYADYFHKQAIDTLTEQIVLSSEAEKAGFTLPEEDQKQYDDLIANIETAAKTANISVDDYLGTSYGKGFNFAEFKKCLKRELVADAWKEYKTDEPTYSDEDLQSYYDENKDTFDSVGIRVESFVGKTSTDDSEAEQYTPAMAKADAEAFMKEATTESKFAELALARAKQEGGESATDETYAENLTLAGASNIDANLGTWAFDESRKAGDCEVIESASGNTYYVAYMVRTRGRIETNVVNVRHILLKVEDSTDEEEVAKVEQEAELLYQKWQEEGGTEDQFAAYAVSNSEDSGSASNGGLYENVYPGQMVQEFNDWCFDPARQPGDSGVIQTQHGWHLMYFEGSGLPKWKIDAESALRSKDYKAYYDEVESTYQVKENKLGLYFRNEPN